MTEVTDPSIYTTLIDSIQNTPILETIKNLPFIDVLISEDAKRLYTFGLGVVATYAYQRLKNIKSFNRAASGQRVSPEIKVSLLQWEKVQGKDGKAIYDLHSSTKSMDLRKILPEEYKEELPKLLIAAAEQASIESPFLVDHIDSAAKSYSSFFKLPGAKEEFAKKIQNFIDEETKYIIQGEWGGGSVLQQAYEVGAKGMKGFYGLWVHQSSDDLEEIRLLILPEKYLHEPLPSPDLVRVREGAKGGNGFYFDTDGNHAHIQRLKILHMAAERLKSDSTFRGKAWISLPVRDAGEPSAKDIPHPAYIEAAATSQKMEPVPT